MFQRISFLGAVGALTGVLFYRDKKIWEAWRAIQQISQDLDKVHDSDCIVFFRATSDHNGAVSQSTTHRALFAGVFQEKKIIPIVKHVSSFGEIGQIIWQLGAQKNRIHTIFISAHGNPSGMQISGDFRRFTHAVNSLGMCIPINLAACNTANEKQGTCFARNLSSYLGGCAVIGSDVEASVATEAFYDREIVLKSGTLSIPYGIQFFGKNGNATKIFSCGSCIERTQIEPSFFQRRSFKPQNIPDSSLLGDVASFVFSLIQKLGEFVKSFLRYAVS